MNRVWTYGLIVLMMAFLVACSQAPEATKDAVATEDLEEIKNITEEMPPAPRPRITPLSPEQMPAFEQAAYQQLHDLTDYTNLLLKPDLDRSFRKQAQKQATAMFRENAQFASFQLIDTEDDSAEAFFKRLFKGSSANVLATSVQDLQLSEFQRLDGEDGFEAILSYQQTIQISKGISAANQNLEVFILPEKKRFGKEEQLVWRVVFGDLKP